MQPALFGFAFGGLRHHQPSRESDSRAMEAHFPDLLLPQIASGEVGGSVCWGIGLLLRFAGVKR